MPLPYFLGCPSWNDAAWRGSVFPREAAAEDFLAHYCHLFNSVEGNTTFYAWPDAAKVARWAQTLPANFRFCAKLPKEISHEGDLRDNLASARRFLALMAPLGERLQPLWLQLPPAFGPQRLAELGDFIDALGARSLAVEVRHAQFFDASDAERALNRLLRDRGVERICLDARALFACRSDDPAVLDAQRRKPRLASVRPTSFSASPQVRFIGGPDLDANDAHLTRWVDKLAEWIEQGLTPHIYLHTPDNRLAGEQAKRFHERLRRRLPGLPALPELRTSQLDLL